MCCFRAVPRASVRMNGRANLAVIDTPPGHVFSDAGRARSGTRGCRTARSSTTGPHLSKQRPREPEDPPSDSIGRPSTVPQPAPHAPRVLMHSAVSLVPIPICASSRAGARCPARIAGLPNPSAAGPRSHDWLRRPVTDVQGAPAHASSIEGLPASREVFDQTGHAPLGFTSLS